MPILEDFNQLIRKVNIIILPRTLHIVMYDINLGVAVFQFTRISCFNGQSQGHPSKMLASAQVMQFLPYRLLWSIYVKEFDTIRIFRFFHEICHAVNDGQHEKGQAADTIKASDSKKERKLSFGGWGMLQQEVDCTVCFRCIHCV